MPRLDDGWVKNFPRGGVEMGLKGLTGILLPSPPVLFNTIENNHSQQCPLGMFLILIR